jgi:endonuclease-3
MTPADARRKLARVLRALERCFGKRPWKCWGNPVDVLVETILSQNTSNANSSAGFARLRKNLGSWDAVARAPVGAVERCIRVSGLSRLKAPRIQAILRRLRSERGRITLDFLAHMSDEQAQAYLLSHKGIGAKTAACVLLFSLNKKVFPVDTHIVRIARRLGLVRQGADADECQKLLTPLIPPGKRYAMHVLLIEQGRRVCRARAPRCEWCDLRRECSALTSRRARPHNAPRERSSRARRPGRTIAGG